MPGTMRTLRWQWLKVLRFWDRAPIRAQGAVTVMIPIIAILVSFASGLRGNWSRAAMETEMRQNFQIVMGLNHLLTSVRTVETSERDFLLTKRDSYRESAQAAAAEVRPLLLDIRSKIEALPDGSQRTLRLEQLAGIERSAVGQVESLRQSRDLGAANVSAETLFEHLEYRSSLMRELESAIQSTQAQQAEELKRQVDEIGYTRFRDYSVLFLALFVGIGTRALSFVLFDKGIVRRINRMTIALASIRNGQPVIVRQPKKKDAIGLLEQEIVNIAQEKRRDDLPDLNSNGDTDVKQNSGN